jgi:hypothetical protein
MNFATHIKQTHLLAKGVLPHRPQMHNLEDQSHLDCWRNAHGVDTGRVVTGCSFDDGTGQTTLHSTGLQRDWTALCGQVETPMLVYLHRGHQPDTRCPILQDLLQTLDHRGGVHALRVEDRRALHDALDLSRALAVRFGLVLVLNDPTRRLCTESPMPAPLRYMLLANEHRAHSLRERQTAQNIAAYQTPTPPVSHTVISEIH